MSKPNAIQDQTMMHFKVAKNFKTIFFLALLNMQQTKNANLKLS